MEYRCVATSVEGFVRQLAVAYITHGYWFYVAGTIPDGKDPAAIDAKLIDRYGIAISKWTRCRRKKQGMANMQYLRHGRFFVLLATKGRHEFFEREQTVIRDVRRKSIQFGGYSIGCRKGRDGRWHASVRFAPGKYAEMKAALLSIALRKGRSSMERELTEFKQLQFSPIGRQVHNAFQEVNRRRRRAGLRTIVKEYARWKERIDQSFEAGAV